jgi:hypothetical protein
VAFVQPIVKVDKEKEFEGLKELVNRALAPEAMERFLRRLEKNDVRVRQFDAVLQKGALDQGKSDPRAEDLYQALTVSDRSQMREFYLSKIEEIEPKLRHKFRRLYQYY